MSVILNKKELGTNELRKDALEILEAGLEAINTEKILREKVRVENGVLYIKNENGETKAELPSPNLGEGLEGEVYFIGIGKCALEGAKVIEDILGNYLTKGAVIDVKPTADAQALVGRSKIEYFQGTHPYPSEQNVEATRKILEMTKGLTKNDLVITLISGGGSALFELPIVGVELETIIERTAELTARGADIYELNTLRKKLSQVKGGKFAEHCAPAQMVSLIFSDVLGNDIATIASGPTVLGPLPNPSPKGRGEGVGPTNILLVSNHDALLAMKSKAQDLGYNTSIETEELSGNASEIGNELATKKIKAKSCLLFGGESTVKISNDHGQGGRNQELVLSALLNIKPNQIILSCASDGWDNSEHAGALVDLELLKNSEDLEINPEVFLKANDSYNFFNIVGGTISTGKLGSNVSDLCIILYK